MNQPPYGPPQGYGYQPQPIVINNSAAASAAASAGPGTVYVRRRQSALVHLVLLFTTGGIGNIIYYLARR